MFSESVSLALGLASVENGFQAIEGVHKATGVNIPVGLKNLEAKPVLHNNCIEVDEMKKVVAKSLGL